MVKMALALQGGGVRGAFTAGVLDVFLENGVVFPYVIGTSAGALTGVNYLSGDRGRSKFIICDLINDPKFLSLHNFLRKKTVFDFAYLLDVVPASIAPFSQKQFDESPIDFYAVATGLEDGKAHYFRKKDCKEFMKGVSASASLPLLSKPVMVEGKPFLDGGPVDSIPFRKPLKESVKKIVVVATRELGFRKKPLSSAKVRLCQQFYGDYPEFTKAFRKSVDVYNADSDLLEALEKEGRIFVIRPDQPVDVSPTEKNKKKLNALYEEGRRIALERLPEMARYLKEESHE